jgi:transcriptional regulator with XRE-family HTH domain
VSSRQLKAARALIGWSQEDLAAASGVSLPTVNRIENDKSPTTGTQNMRDRLAAALSTAGVVFIFEDELGAGARLRARS